MSAFGLIVGVVAGSPEMRVSGRNGQSYCRVTLKVPAGDRGFERWRVLAFGPVTAAALMKLKAGEPIAVKGALRIGSFDDERSGEEKLSRTLMVDCLMPLDPTDAQSAQIYEDVVGGER